MRSRNDNNAAALGSAGGLEERIREYLRYEKLAMETHCTTRYLIVGGSLITHQGNWG